jgi:hypothetical protein
LAVDFLLAFEEVYLGRQTNADFTITNAAYYFHPYFEEACSEAFAMEEAAVIIFVVIVRERANNP